MATYEDDYRAVEAARNKVSSLTQKAGQEEASAMTFRDEVMDRVRQARADRGMTTLQNDLGQATERLASGRTQIRTRLADNVNPIDVDQITNAERSQALGTLATIAEIMNAREGTIEDVVGAGKNRVLAETTKTKTMADAAGEELSNLMQVIQVKQQEAQRAIENEFSNKQFDEGKRQFGERMKLDWAQLNKSGGGSREPDKYPFSEPYISAGLAGKQVSDVGNKTAAEFAKRLKKTEPPSTAAINAAKDAGYTYNPIKQTFDPPEQSWWQKLFNWGQ